MGIFIKDGIKLKVSHKKNTPKFMLLYKCPNCINEMVFSPQSVFTRVNEGYEIWDCEKCNKKWRLTFQELIKVENKKND